MKRLVLFLAFLLPMLTFAADIDTLRKRAEKLTSEQNWKDALPVQRELVFDAANAGKQLAEDIEEAVFSHGQLGQSTEAEALVTTLLTERADIPWVQLAAASYFDTAQHRGFVVGGQFFRSGGYRQGGRHVYCYERDRAQMMAAIGRATTLFEKTPPAPAEKAAALVRLAALMVREVPSWQLGSLTPLDPLPDYGETWPDLSSRGAPVGDDGLPKYHAVPESWAAAKTDGERWRWLLAQAAAADPKGKAQATLALASFMEGEIGVGTLSEWHRPVHRDEKEPATYAVHTLTDDETLAQLATGPKRFAVPAEFNPIRLFTEVAGQKADPDSAKAAIGSLAGIFEERMQYPRAAAQWKRLMEEFGENETDDEPAKRFRQITGNWGRFDTHSAQPAGREPTFPFAFRNAKKVSFSFRKIDFPAIVADMTARMRANTLDPDSEDMPDIGELASLLDKPALSRRFVSQPLAAKEMALEPRENHWERRIDVKAPLTEAGAYIVEAKIDGGNTTRTVLWLNDTLIVKKAAANGTLFYVADAVTGQPLPKMILEFLGAKSVERNGKTRYDVRRFAESTDESGLFLWKADRTTDDYDWFVSASDGRGRFAMLWDNDGYGGSDSGQNPTLDDTKVFFASDRPVYRPGQPVKWKAWIRQVRYDLEGSGWAGKSLIVRVEDPKGEKLVEKSYKSDAYGGIDDVIELPEGAALGAYRVSVGVPGKRGPGWMGSGRFRVEEYKKPEFEVTVDAPKIPVALGEKVTATVKAVYYFGAPVAKARAKLKVERTTHDGRWYPVWRWDWLYGSGAWWFGRDNGWYPGFRRWGCLPPVGPGWSHDPPESILEKEVDLDADGTAKVEFDTAAAKELLGDTDHRYEISVSITDESRRTIDGSGSVLVARDPFRVYAWTDRGHYEVGMPIEASFRAQSLDGKGIAGKGRLSLLKIAYNEKKEPQETEVAGFDIATDATGEATQKLSASEPGQYRLSLKLTDAQNRTQEGGHLLVITGPGFDGRQFHFNALELTADRKNYAPGDTAQLLVNTENADGTVLLFVRPQDGTYSKPRVLRLKGKSVSEALKIEARDQPNIFVEALTVADAQVHTEVREIFVPPESRVLTLEAKPSADRLKPRETAKIDLKLTDAEGKPFVGSTVVTIYDKALEYISGGSNVPEIRAFFWKWTRDHHAETEDSLWEWGDDEPVGQERMEDLDKARIVYERASEGDSFNGIAFGGYVGRGGATAMKRGRGNVLDEGVGEALAAPMAAAAPGAAYDAAPKAASKPLPVDAFSSEGGESDLAAKPVMIRSQFADAALWVAAIETKPDGTATVDLPMPDNLTTWKVRSWAMGQGTRVGQAEAEIITSKDLLVRLQAPRFFVEKDEVTLSANVHSYLDTKKEVTVSLELDGGTLEAADAASLTKKITLDPKAEQRVDWTVKAVKEGEATVRMKAVADTDSDAMEQKFPVLVHGMLKTDSWSGALRPDQAEAGKIAFTVPEERRPEQSELIVRVSPSLALSMLDAVPYLVDYPYGCTEQTLNRFLPAVLARRTLQRTGVDLRELEKKTTNLNAQEIGDPAKRAGQWKRYDRNPVFSEGKMTRIVKANLEKLTGMQRADGSWGWFAGAREGDAHLTATVVRGLLVAKEAEVPIVPGVLKNGIDWLGKHQAAQVQEIRNAPGKTKPWKEHADDMDALVFTVLAGTGSADNGMSELLFRDKGHLSVYSKAMLAVGYHTLGHMEKRDALRKNVEQFLVTDAENQTARLRLGNEGYWWHWYGSEYEAQAWYLKLLARVEPKGSTASGLVKWLLNNRKNATWWNSTRDTALVLEAMADYLKATGEGEPAMTIRVLVDGVEKKSIPVSKDNLFTLDNTLTLRGADISSGAHTVEVRREGKGPVYFNAYLTNFTKEDAIPAAGLEVKVDRRYWKLTPKQKTQLAEGSRGQALQQQASAYDRAELKSGDALASGTLVEVELILESKNDYEYLLIEDPKAAGFEPVDVQSGYDWSGLGAYRELRDQKVALFVRRLPTGRSTLNYRLRAEVPGKFSALPAKASAMYAPELRGNSAEAKLGITER